MKRQTDVMKSVYAFVSLYSEIKYSRSSQYTICACYCRSVIIFYVGAFSIPKDLTHSLICFG